MAPPVELPLGQGEQTAAPDAEKESAAQAEHTASAVGVHALDVKLPAAQAVHAVQAAAPPSEKPWPDVHGVQIVAPAEA